MKLQGRNLSSGMHGDEMKLLQRELQQLGYPVPTAEIASASFGANTYDAVCSFQAKNGLPITNIVDRATADKINAVVGRLNPFQSLVVRGANSSGGHERFRWRHCARRTKPDIWNSRR